MTRHTITSCLCVYFSFCVNIYKQVRPLCTIFRILATICHYLSSTTCISLSLPVIAGKNEHRLVATIRWKEQASSRSRRHVFRPDEFLRSRVTGQSTSGSTPMRLPFPSRTYVLTQPTVSIDLLTEMHPPEKCCYSIHVHRCLQQASQTVYM